MKELMKLNEQNKVSSLDLVEQINFFREGVEGKSALGHNDLLKVIRDEFEEEISLGEFSQSSYTNERGREYTLYELTTSQAKQVLVRESKAVRKSVIKYIEVLEERVNSQQKTMTYKESLLALVAEIEAREQVEALLEEKTTQLDESKEWYSMKRVAMLTGKSVQKFSWRILKNESDYLGYDVKKIFDANYGQVNTYHRDIWLTAYPEVTKALQR